MCAFPLRKIVSGGQTGVDRAALDVARFLEIEHGGWCPKQRRAEDGPIPPEYRLTEIHSHNYVVRTRQNVIDSDGTLILYRSELTGGTALTQRLAFEFRRPFLSVDLDTLDDESARLDAKGLVLSWLADQNISVVNIAGPRESTSPGIARQADQFLVAVLAELRQDTVQAEQRA